MESEEYIDFETIRSYININNLTLFTSYLKEVYKDLSDRAESNKKKGISKLTFLEYIKLPVFIGEKLFTALDIDSDCYLNVREFIDGLSQLYLGYFDQTVEVIFRIFDFDKDGLINKGDIKILLSYLPLKTDNYKIEYKFQMESLEEIDEILKHTFQNNIESLSLEEFQKVIEYKKSDAFLQLLCFLYQKKPFKEENINMLKVYRRRSANNVVDTKDFSDMVTSPQPRRLPSPNRKSVFSPADSFLKITLKNEDGQVNSDISLPNIKPELKRKSTFLDNKNSPSMGMIRMPNEKIIDKNEKNTDLETVIKKSKNVYSSPTRFLNKGTKQMGEFNLEENLIQLEELNIDDEKEIDPVGQVIYEDWICKVSESLKLKKYWLVLIGKDIYYYKDEKKEDLLGMHNLSGSFIKENGEKKINGERLYSFSIIFTGKLRTYYCSDKASALKWSSCIKTAIGYLSFFDFYEMLDDIGEGKFGLVKLGLHKKTKERVAIKIIKKESMKNASDVELVKSEIDIMKLCRHPNVVKLLDHFENAEYIFIVMEHIAGGDLSEYLTNVKFNLSEQRAAEVMYQLACGIQYLHQYGVLHRDLKPENIMLTECSDKGLIKIMDFGLSKIMGPDEKVADGFGTLSFVAPEVLIRQPYGKQIDIWSLGVILYYILSNTLPFDDESDNEELIAKMTVFNEVQFPHKYWSKRSQDVIDLISRSLIKDPNKRILIDEFLAHPWIVKYNRI